MAKWQLSVYDASENEKKADRETTPEALHRKLHAAYAFVRSEAENRKLFTLDHLIEERIKSLKKGEVRQVVDSAGNPYKTPIKRVSKLDLLSKLEDDVQAVIDHYYPEKKKEAE